MQRRPPVLPGGVGQRCRGDGAGADTNWGEVAELVTESYCLLAPKKLAAQVARPALPEDEVPGLG